MLSLMNLVKTLRMPVPTADSITACVGQSGSLSRLSTSICIGRKSPIGAAPHPDFAPQPSPSLDQGLELLSLDVVSEVEDLVADVSDRFDSPKDKLAIPAERLREEPAEVGSVRQDTQRIPETQLFEGGDVALFSPPDITDAMQSDSSSYCRQTSSAPAKRVRCPAAERMAEWPSTGN